MPLPATRSAALLAGLLVATLCLPGCASLRQGSNRTPPDKVAETAQFYWKYAALAADVYSTGGRVDEKLQLVKLSSWLRSEIDAVPDPQARDEISRSLTQDAKTLYARRLGRSCPGDGSAADAAGDDDAVRASEGRCRGTQGNDPTGDEAGDPDLSPEQSDEVFSVADPSKPEDCSYRGKEHPAVPVQRAVEEFQWESVPELQRQLHPRDWSIFVPGLAIDVWRRRESSLPGAPPEVEYALVYRGTVGSGAWLSNFRALTAFTPLMWDQYRQAQRATTSLVNQIYRLHAISDELFKRPQTTRIRITSVGHSLGGGLATYVFLRVPQLTRVVNFDPSPVDGASTFTPFPPASDELKRGRRDRSSVLAQRKQPLHTEPRGGDAAIFTLYEEGEILTRMTGCQSGPLWGAEGGPNVLCESLDLSGGSVLRQHNMAQLACKLFLAKSGLPTR